MPFMLPGMDQYLDVALRIDDALMDMTDEQWKDYIDYPDPDKLLIKPGETPTWIRMKVVLPWRHAAIIEDMKLSMTQKDGEQVVVPKLSWMHEEVRLALVDIINPPGCENPVSFKRDGDGGATHQLAAQLLQMGVMPDLWNARQNFNKRAVLPDKKK